MSAAYTLITGGGTAGHVLPALAIADALVDHGRRTDEIVYVGAQRGIETRLLPATPYAHHELDVVGLQRGLSPSSLRRNLALPVKLIRSIGAARRLLRRYRPAVVVSVGGYASMPSVVAARLSRTPVVVVSYDTAPGLASRLSARFAAACAVALPGSRLPRARLTGAPVRRELVTLDRGRDRDQARDTLGVPRDRRFVAVMGGSLGSKVLNEAVTGMVETLAERRDLAVLHIVGERFLGDAAPARSGESGIMYAVVGYEDRLAAVYAAADLMITRAGASTIAELAATGSPAIIVPWAGAADDHQTANAALLGDIGAATVLTEAELSAERLTAQTLRMLDDREGLDDMARAAWDAGELHRSDRLVRLIDDVAGAR